MGFRSLLVTLAIAAAAAGLSLFAARHDMLVLVVAALAAGFAAGGIYLRNHGRAILEELAMLREHLDTTRQQAAMLARMTREMRDIVNEQSDTGQASEDGRPTIAAMTEVVRDIADNLADLDRRTDVLENELALLRRETVMRPAAQPLWQAPPPVATVLPATPAEENLLRPALREMPPVPDVASFGEPPRAVRQLVAAAIAADRFDLFLQRIVSLPQRKTRAYEVSLRPDGGDPRLTTGDIRAAVEHVGHQLAFDRKLMVQTIRLARMFEQRNRDVMLVADISQRYLLSEAAFDELRALVADAPGAPRRIVLSLPQRFFRKAVAVENEALRLLGDMGFRFMMREVSDFAFDLPRLQQADVRWVRVDAARLIAGGQSEEMAMDVAAADFAALLGRRQISLLVDNVADEAMVAELIDFNIAFAQGAVFAPPQAVRPEALDQQMAQGALRGAPPEPSTPERRGLRDIARRA
jgi:cyclic-di-GMP phosphodiesterase TipF (flagellum assembly factor)